MTVTVTGHGPTRSHHIIITAPCRQDTNTAVKNPVDYTLLESSCREKRACRDSRRAGGTVCDIAVLWPQPVAESRARMGKVSPSSVGVVNNDDDPIAKACSINSRAELAPIPQKDASIPPRLACADACETLPSASEKIGEFQAHVSCFASLLARFLPTFCTCAVLMRHTRRSKICKR